MDNSNVKITWQREREFTINFNIKIKYHLSSLAVHVVSVVNFPRRIFFYFQNFISLKNELNDAIYIFLMRIHMIYRSVTNFTVIIFYSTIT